MSVDGDFFDESISVDGDFFDESISVDGDFFDESISVDGNFFYYSKSNSVTHSFSNFNFIDYFRFKKRGLSNKLFPYYF